jgi:FMN-dependent NADH-azoreductase
MTVQKILYIKASPRGSDSKSAAIADAYLTALRGRIPDLIVDTLDLSAEKLPEFDGDKVAAKIAVLTGQTHQGRRKTAWDEITGVANRFIEADCYLLAVPMWNDGIPYRLKQYIDVIHQPGLLWGLDPKTGYFGLLMGKKAVLTLTSGASVRSARSFAWSRGSALRS